MIAEKSSPSIDRSVLLEAVERSTKAGLAAVDGTGRQSYVNPAFCDMVGFAAEELIGTQAPFPYWPPEELDAIQNAFELTIRGAAPADGFELRFMRKTGERFHAQLLLSPLTDKSGAVLGYLASLYDVTERKRREQEEQIRRRLEAVLEHLPVGVMIAEAPSGKTIFSNAQAQRIFGGPITATESSSLYDVNFRVWDKHGRLLESEQYPLVRAVRGEHVEGEELVFARGTGERRVVRVNGAPVLDGDGKLAYAVVAYFDITDRIALEDALRHSEERFRTLAEATNEIVWTTDPSGRFVGEDWPSWRRFTGQTAEHVLSGKAWDALHPDDLPAVQADWLRAVEAQRDFAAEYRLRRHDGVYVPVFARGTPVRNDDGSIREWVGYAVDVSERKRHAEERTKLLMSERAARAEAEASRRRMAFLDRLTAELLVDLGESSVKRVAKLVVPTLADWCTVYVERDGRIEALVVAHSDDARAAAAQAALAEFHIDPSLPWGIPAVLRTGRSELVADVTEAMLREAAGPSPQQWAVLRGSGIRSHLAVPLRVGDRIIGVLGLAITDSERRLSDVDLEIAEKLGVRVALAMERARLFEAAESARQQAEQANRAKDEFLAMLGHELRNPLAPMVTALQLLRLKGADTGLRELAVMDRQLRHMTTLVDDLLDVARITRGKIVLKKERIPLEHAIGKAIEMASPLFEQRGTHLHVSVPSQQMIVEGDAGRLAQVFGNILSNAAKYTPPGGHVSIAAARERTELVVRIQDDGIGIDSALLPRIFDMFAQGPQAAARERGGLGLGLTIVRNLVLLHGGSIEAASDGTGKGTSFTVRLPSADPLQPDVDASAAAPVRRRPSPIGPVLIVDDNEDAAMLLADALRMLGCDCSTAHDGPTAIEMAKAKRPAVVLLDIGLPVMDGYEVARQLRTLFGHGVKLIAVTGYGQEADRRQTLAAGFTEHLVKPIDFARLEAILDAGNLTPAR